MFGKTNAIIQRRSAMSTIIHQRVEAARRGENPNVVARLKSGWAVMGDVQFLAGYCLLLPDPVVPDLNALSGKERQQYMNDMALLGDAVLAATGAKRINYEILGNLEPALHAHVFPRFHHEPIALATKPVWFYDWSAAPKFDPAEHGELMTKIRGFLLPHSIG
jgi:diadenosine tetraphosphate (Ap4A) HIT family hydrolase